MTEILIICGVIVLLFGAGQIPKFARSIGKAKKEYEKGIEEGGKPDRDEDKTEENTPDTKS